MAGSKASMTQNARVVSTAGVLALKLYGEPWKDIFFDQALVATPRWVLAAPLVHGGRKLGAVLWLSSCRPGSLGSGGISCSAACRLLPSPTAAAAPAATEERVAPSS
ncbi:Receptor-interacting serine/threonine-protein kinase 3 [Pleodorina starrii]|nr:Receptor-interacting serine/threonine-protein kinase 3 [Pleodorina starrii]